MMFKWVENTFDILLYTGILQTISFRSLATVIHSSVIASSQLLG